MPCQHINSHIFLVDVRKGGVITVGDFVGKAREGMSSTQYCETTTIIVLPLML